MVRLVVGAQVMSPSIPVTSASAALSEKNRLTMLVSKIVVCRSEMSRKKMNPLKRRVLRQHVQLPAQLDIDQFIRLHIERDGVVVGCLVCTARTVQQTCSEAL
jgi:hypothetical protein